MQKREGRSFVSPPLPYRPDLGRTGRKDAALPRSPLPPLATALSRRAALFGAVVVTGALAGSTVASAVTPAGNDARLAELATALDHTLVQTDHALDPHQDATTQHAHLEEADATLALMVQIPADTLAGCGSKAKAYLACDDFDVQNTYKLGMSLAQDVLRLDRSGQ